MLINGYGGYGLLAAAQASWLGPKVGGHLVPFLYSSCEPSELSQWLCCDGRTVNIVVVIIFDIFYSLSLSSCVSCTLCTTVMIITRSPAVGDRTAYAALINHQLDDNTVPCS